MENKKTNFKRAMAIVLSAVTIMSAATVAVFAVSADFTGNKTVQCKFQSIVTENGIDKIAIPAFGEGVVDINIKEDGYYTMSVWDDGTRSSDIITLLYDDKGEMLDIYDNIRENDTVYNHFFEKGDYQLVILNKSYDKELVTSLKVESYDDYVKNFDTKSATPLVPGTDEIIKANETKTFKIENEKTDKDYYIFAEGECVSVQVYDGNFNSMGYDSTALFTKGRVEQYVYNGEERKDEFYAVVTNQSAEDVLVSYLAEDEYYSAITEAVSLNTPVTTDEGYFDSNSYNCHKRISFTPDKTRDYEIIFAPGIYDYVVTVYDYETDELIEKYADNVNTEESSSDKIQLEAGRKFLMYICTTSKESKSEFVLK